jgi:beta-glucosidase
MIPVKKISLFLLCAGLSAAVHSQKGAAPVYLDARATPGVRARDLLNRMNLKEKIAQMCQYAGLEHIRSVEQKYSAKQLGGNNNDAHAFYKGLSIEKLEQMVADGMIGSFLHVLSPQEANHLQRLAQKSRLKIPLLVGIDAIHGNGMVSGSTIYPSPLGLAATWDTSLVKQTAQYTATEMRATGSHWAFSPNLDIGRDARWGRTGETYGEDPFLVTIMGVQMIRGLQGNGQQPLNNVLACAKHLVAGSEPVNGLNAAPTDLSERTLKEIYLPPYRAAVDAGVLTIMPAHNEINGVPGHANRYLMDKVLRKEWGFKGFYISDWMDVERLVTMHGIARDTTEAILKTTQAGLDMHMHGPGYMEALLQLISTGALTEARINESVLRILEMKFRLGLFEQPFVDEAAVARQVFTPVHTQLALKAAEESIVLLKNNNVLPLAAGRYKKILVTGPNANNQTILGDWSLLQPDSNVVTIFEGLQEQRPAGTTVEFFDVGSSVRRTESSKIQEAAARAKEADVVVVVVGENSLRYLDNSEKTSGENIDRDDIGLPGDQQALVEALQRSGKPVVVVLVNSRPLGIQWIAQNVAGIVEAWEPGSLGGTAVANILYGTTNPSGKLPISFPRTVGQIHTFYNHKPSAYSRSFATNASGPLFTFGQGLSYTRFRYDDLVLGSKRIRSKEQVTVSVNVTNTGDIEGDEIVQLYIHEPAGDVTRPVKQLKGFRRIHLKAKETRRVQFTITPAMLANYDLDMQYKVSTGNYSIMVGGSSVTGELKQAMLSVKE